MTTAVAKLNGIDTDALRQTMSQVARDPASGIARFAVTTAWKGGPRSESRVDGWELGGKRLEKNFTIAIDEPPELLGGNTAPNPQEYLLASVNACMLATYVAACAMKGITLERLEIRTSGELDLRGFLGLDRKVKSGYDALQYTVHIKGDGTDEQFQEVHEWVKRTSPNYWNIAQPVRMNADLVIE